MLPDWSGQTVAILASGPSLTPEVCDVVQGGGWPMIAINLTFRRVPMAEVVYACDCKFWDAYIKEAREVAAGLLLTQDEEAERKYGIQRIPSVAKPGLSKTAGVIHQGGNSGYQAIGIAAQAGASTILLFGFDMHGKKGSHWHGDHIPGLHEQMPFHEWVPRFDQLAADLSEAGVDVINCTPGSALQCFRSMSLRQVEHELSVAV